MDEEVEAEGDEDKGITDLQICVILLGLVAFGLPIFVVSFVVSSGGPRMG